jgi:hypothetical protein
MSWQDTPIYIINRNNLERGFRRQIEWLQAAGMTNIHVIDNASTYQPLIKFYNEHTDIKVIYAGANLGPYALWTLKIHERLFTRFIVSDADCVPDKDCPQDLVRKLHEVFEKYPCYKVGAGIRIDNLPDRYTKKDAVIKHETQFSLPVHLMPDGDAFEALVDTTFGMYNAGEANPSTDWCRHYRLAAPYVIEHIPWHEDSENPSEECLYYRAHVENGWSCWETQ